MSPTLAVSSNTFNGVLPINIVFVAWATRTLIVRKLKGLENLIRELSIFHSLL
jgi:hypothetical protein